MAEFVTRLEGLPFRASKDDIKEFFADCSLDTDGIHLILNAEGRASGVGYAKFPTEEDRAAALKQDGKDIGNFRRYVKVVECEADELRWYLNRQANASSGKFRVRMQGMPFRVSEYEVATWFEPEAQCADVEIHLNNEGRPSGRATAFFETLAEAEKSMVKDKADLKGRYINLTLENAEKPLSRSGFFVRMAGLPYRASEAEIKEFFAPVAECISVRIILNQEGRPSGDAIAEFETNEDADKAMSLNREHIGQRFVVLSREDGGADAFLGRGNSDGGRGGGGGGGGSEFSIRMGGLPYRSSVNEIMEWFQPEAECTHVRIIMNREGRPRGEAIAEFATREDALKAMTKNRQYMGERFVILTPQFDA